MSVKDTLENIRISCYLIGKIVLHKVNRYILIKKRLDTENSFITFIRRVVKTMIIISLFLVMKFFLIVWR